MTTDIIFDGNSLFARSWFAVMKDSKDGQQAVRASLASLLSVMDHCVKDPGITRTLFCWDAGRKNDKARSPKPEGFKDALAVTQDLMEAVLDTTNTQVEGNEADDVVATAAIRSKADQVYVVSGDKDLQQLQGGNVTYYSLNTKGPLSNHTITEKWGVKHPCHVAIALAILGDQSDNIKGVPKWGPKKVEKLFSKVTDKMGLMEATEAVLEQMPEDIQGVFIESLELTALDSNLKGVAQPSPLTWADADLLEEIGFGEMIDWYSRVARTRSRRSGPADLDDFDY